MNSTSTEGPVDRKRLRESPDILFNDKKTKGLELNFLGKALVSKIKMVPLAKKTHERINYIFFYKLGCLPEYVKAEVAIVKYTFDVLSEQNYFVSDLSDWIIRARKILDASYNALSN